MFIHELSVSDLTEGNLFDCLIRLTSSSSTLFRLLRRPSSQ